MKLLTGLKVALLAAVMGAGMGSVAQARDFTIASWGGSYQDVLREVYFKPFAEAAGIKFLEDTYLGGWAQFEAMQKTGVVNWDVVQVETSELIRGCDEGTFIELDWSKIVDKSTLVPGSATTCGIGTIVVATLPAYNAELTKTPPTKLEDFWDLNTWPGKRGLRKGPKFNLELAMLADGVPANEVYKALGTPEGLDRAFKKLDEIKANIQWWEAGDQPPTWLATGDVAMSIAYNARISNANKEGKKLALIWDKFVYDMDQWVIMKDSPNQDAAYKFLAFFAQPGPQIEFMKRYAYGTPSIEAGNAITGEAAENLPIGEKMAGGLLMGTPEAMKFWLDNIDAVTERWNAWAGAN